VPVPPAAFDGTIMVLPMKLEAQFDARSAE